MLTARRSRIGSWARPRAGRRSRSLLPERMCRRRTPIGTPSISAGAVLRLLATELHVLLQPRPGQAWRSKASARGRRTSARLRLEGPELGGPARNRRPARPGRGRRRRCRPNISGRRQIGRRRPVARSLESTISRSWHSISLVERPPTRTAADHASAKRRQVGGLQRHDHARRRLRRLAAHQTGASVSAHVSCRRCGRALACSASASQPRLGGVGVGMEQDRPGRRARADLLQHAAAARAHSAAPRRCASEHLSAATSSRARAARPAGIRYRRPRRLSAAAPLPPVPLEQLPAAGRPPGARLAFGKRVRLLHSPRMIESTSVHCSSTSSARVKSVASPSSSRGSAARMPRAARCGTPAVEEVHVHVAGAGPGPAPSRRSPATRPRRARRGRRGRSARSPRTPPWRTAGAARA